MLTHRYTKCFLGILVGAALTFFVAQALGVFPTQINYCSDHEANYHNCASHYLVVIPLIWIANHLEVVATIMTAIATVYIAKFTIVLSRIGKQQADDARVVQRAYVFVKQPQAAILVDPNNRLAGVRVWASLKNSGTTPAPRMRALTAATFVEQESDFKI
jgi:hypothetical protein